MNKNLDTALYGTKYWYTDIHFNEFPARFYLNEREYNISKGMSPIRLEVVAINYPRAEDWENEMYDTLFDSCKGTEWNKVKRIEI